MKARISLVFVFLLVIVHVPSSAISRRIGVNCCSKTFDLSTNVKFVIRTANYYALNYSTCSNTFKLGNSCPSMVVKCRKRIEEIGNPVDGTPDGLNFTYGETTARLLRNPKVKMQVCNSDMSSCTTTRPFRKIRTNETSMTVSFKTDSTDDGYGYTCTIKCDVTTTTNSTTTPAPPLNFVTQVCGPIPSSSTLDCTATETMNSVTIRDANPSSVVANCCSVSNLVATRSMGGGTAPGNPATCPAGTYVTSLCADTVAPHTACGGSGTQVLCSTSVWDGIAIQPGAMCNTFKGASGAELDCPATNEVITSACVSATGMASCDGAFASIVCCNVVRA